MPTKDMLRFVQNGTDASIFHVVGRNTIDGHLKRLKFLLVAAHDLANAQVQRAPQAIRCSAGLDPTRFQKAPI